MCSVPSSRVTRTVIWWFSVSTNSGQSWTHRKITTDSKWPQCITDQDNGSNRTRAPIVYNPGTGRILLSISRSQTSADGQNVGLRSVLYQYPTAAGLIGFDSWIPVCNPEVCPPGLSTCMLSGTLPAGESFCNQYGQELAVTNATPVPVAAMAWHDTRDSVNPPTPSTKKTPQYLNLQVSIWGASVRPGTPYDAYPTTQSRITPVGPGTGVPWTQVATNGNTAWGDYEGMTAAPGGPFHAFWGDNSAGGVSQVFTAPFSP